MKLFISAQSLPDPKSMPMGEDFSDAEVRRLVGALAEIQHYSKEAMRKLDDLKLQYQHISHHEAISALRNELQMIQLMNSRLSY